jgi:predicted GNAT family N-acyltransferase
MWPNQSVDYVKLPNDSEGIHFGLFKGAQLVSVISAFISEDHAQFRKFATLTEEQGNGHGSLLLEHLISVLHQQNITKIWCNARIDKVHYYQRYGLKQTDKTFSKGGIDFVIMELIKEDS